MADTNGLDRREFTRQSLMAMLSGVAISVSACGGGDGGPTGGSPTPGGNVTGSISANHGHTATLVAADLAAGNQVNLDIRGGADHTHSVELSGAEVSQVAGGQRVVKRSSNEDTHFHEVTFN